MKSITLPVLIIWLLTLGGCSLYGGTQNNTSRSAANPTPAPVTPAGLNMINIQNFSFNPATLTIKKGTTIAWTNNDSAPHQIKSATFNSNPLSAGQSYSFTFNDIGAFDYICAIHPSMRGKIIVTAPVDNAPAAPNKNPINDKLNLSGQQLKKIPDYVFNLTDLEELDLSNNQLTGAIQAEIRRLQKLKALNASNNLMTGVPAEIGQLKNLQILDLSNNQLTGLPYELGNLKNLKALNLSGNNYSQPDLNIIMQGLPKDVNIIK